MHDEKCSGWLSIITDDLVELARKRIMENRRFTIKELSNHFPLLVARNCHGAPAFQEIVRQVVTEATDTRTPKKAHEVSIDISVAVP